MFLIYWFGQSIINQEHLFVKEKENVKTEDWIGLG